MEQAKFSNTDTWPSHVALCARSTTYTSSVPSVVKKGGCVASLCFDMAA